MARPRPGHIAIAATAVVLVGIATAGFAFASTPSHNPTGGLDSVTQIPNTVSIVGGAADPDTAAPINVYVFLDGVQLVLTRANLPWHHGHGFGITMNIAKGTHTVCATAINVGPGANTPIGCKTITVNHDPAGGLDQPLQIPNKVQVTGAAADPDTSNPVTVHLTIDNHAQPDLIANAAAHHGRGFAAWYPLANGTHTICATAVNQGAGSDASFGCRTIVVNYNPYGGIAGVTQIPNKVQVAGLAADPDTSAPINVTLSADGKPLGTLVANQPTHHGHGFSASYSLPNGTHTFCAVGINVGAGSNASLGCVTATLNFNPRGGIDAINRVPGGFEVVGGALDPDTTSPIKVQVNLDGRTVGTITANAPPHHGYGFAASYPITAGSHQICVVGINVGVGTNAQLACQTVSFGFNPVGALGGATRVSGSTSITASGWVLDPDTASPSAVSITVDGATVGSGRAAASVTGIPSTWSAYGTDHGFSVTVPATDGEHKVCAIGVNVAQGTGNTPLGCVIVIAVHPKPPSAPLAVGAQAGFGGATISWSPPASDGGAPPSSYTVTSAPGGISLTVDGNTTSTTLVGLNASTGYTFSVVAHNVAGTSPAGVSPRVVTQASPPPQTTPAPISTSRYIRNIYGASSTDLSTMRAEGTADARANPSGHGYLILLDIGGQDQFDGGVVLSATTRFITYADLVANLKAYVDGYAAGQRPSAPITIALGTNNDMDVTAAAGAAWATSVVNPVASYAHRYLGVMIAGANDIEPGFRGTYAQTAQWLDGYLKATSAPFVFNGSADGCAWTVINGSCNNGWTMAGMYHLAEGAAPIRSINLPQIYNDTMAAQWKYISLTGIAASQPRINFGGALTEWTACSQAGGCGSLTGNEAWAQLWAQLQSAPQTHVGSLPYSTDLRIDK